MAATTENGGASDPAIERAELHEHFSSMYANATEGKPAVLREIAKLLGPGHEEGNKPTLIERAVTATMMSNAAEAAAADRVEPREIPGESNDDVEQFEEIDLGAQCDFRQYQFEALKAIRKEIADAATDIKKINKISREHEFRYRAGNRGYCTICPDFKKQYGELEDEEDEEEDEEEEEGSKKKCQKSTALVCMTCKCAARRRLAPPPPPYRLPVTTTASRRRSPRRTYVCTGAFCITAHVCNNAGNPMKPLTWSRLKVRTLAQGGQGGHKEVASRASAAGED